MFFCCSGMYYLFLWWLLPEFELFDQPSRDWNGNKSDWTEKFASLASLSRATLGFVQGRKFRRNVKVRKPSNPFQKLRFLARDQLPLSKTDRLLLFVLHRYFSKEPHLAGSKRNNDLAHHIATKWREYGFDEVTMPKYDVLMSSPKKDRKSHVEIHRNGRVIFKSQSHEKVITVCMLTVLLFWLLWLWFLSM